MYKKIFFLLVSALIINSCQNSSGAKPVISTQETLSSDKKLYSDIYNALLRQNLDDADDIYIKLKTSYDSSEYALNAALDLAIAHMQKREYILANFYLQERLAQNSDDEFAKFLLVKNQFLSVIKSKTDQNYMQKAFKALEVNRNLVTDSDYSILANSMLTRVKLDIAWKNREIGSLYKRLNKQEAAKLYQEKINALGVNVNDIYKP